MSQDKIEIKDVTPKTFNPKTHKNTGDRFNPSNRIYVRESKGTFQQLRRYGGWLLLVLFAMVPWIPYGERQAVLLDLGHQQFNFFGTTLYPQESDLAGIAVHDFCFRSVLSHHLLRSRVVWLFVSTNRLDLHVHLV